MDDYLIPRRVAMLEQQVRLLSEKLGVPCPPLGNEAVMNPPPLAQVPAEVVELARAGKSIAAMNLLRQLTGMGLREAKDLVESLPPVL